MFVVTVKNVMQVWQDNDVLIMHESLDQCCHDKPTFQPAKHVPVPGY